MAVVDAPVHPPDVVVAERATLLPAGWWVLVVWAVLLTACLVIEVLAVVVLLRLVR